MAQVNVKVGDVLDFSAGCSSWRGRGRCVLVKTAKGRKWYRWTFLMLEGDKKGGLFIGSTVYPDVERLGPVVGEELAIAKEAAAALESRATDHDQACVVAKLSYEAGDIVNIQNRETGTNWNMKVMKIDYAKGRVCGVPEKREAGRVSRTYSFASFKSPDVIITLIERQAFNPDDDPVVKAQKDFLSRKAKERAKKAKINKLLRTQRANS